MQAALICPGLESESYMKVLQEAFSSQIRNPIVYIPIPLNNQQGGAWDELLQKGRYCLHSVT